MQILEKARGYLKKHDFQTIETSYVMGSPASAICDNANESDMDLIIIGSHGHQGLAKFLMGSTTKGVFKCAAKPVIVLNNAEQTTSIQISEPGELNISSGEC
jgi:nucleotide-binding universal stress UspA family protein